jgi:hypothetical protein
MLFGILQDVFRGSSGCAHHYIILECPVACLINLLNGFDKRASMSYRSGLEQIDINWGLAPAFYSVSELTGAIRGLLTDHFTDIWVAGEISGTRGGAVEIGLL